MNGLKEYIKTELYKFARRFDLEILVIENAVTIPLNLPLGLAITEFIAETGYPTMRGNHRQREGAGVEACPAITCTIRRITGCHGNSAPEIYLLSQV